MSLRAPAVYTTWVIFRFAPFEVDDATFELRRTGEPIPLQRKDFDVLCYLIQNRSRVVRKEELIEAVWSKETVVDTAVHRVVSRLRHALGQEGRDRPIETIHGRGYRFRANVHTEEPEPGPKASLPVEDRQEPLTSERDADPFVGRNEVIAGVLRAYREAPQRGGQVFLFTGEPGSGKSRAADQATRLLERQGALVLRARGLEFDGAPAFWPWVQILREVVARRPPEDPLAVRGSRLLGQMNPDRGFVDTLALRQRSDSALYKFRLQDQLSEFVLSLCAETKQCCVVWLDDLSLRDQDSIQVLDLISCGLRQTPFVILVTVRSDPTLSMAQLIALMPDSTQVIALEALRPADVHRYVSIVTGTPDPSALAERIAQKTGGNPLFMREMVRFLVTTYGADNLSGDQVDMAHFPAALREVVDWRLRGFEKDERYLLEVASVCGESFELPILKRVTGADPARLFAVLDAAIRYGVLQRTQESIRYRFAHGLIQEVLYNSLASSDSARLHCAIAEVLELHAVDSASLTELAYHAYRGLPYGDPSKAVKHAATAAKAVASSGAYRDTLRFLGWALEAQKLEPEANPRRRCKLLANAAIAATGTGDAHENRRCVEELVEIATRNQFPDVLAIAGLILRPVSEAIYGKPDSLARQALEAAASGLPPAADSLRARVLSALSTLPPYSQDREKRLEMTARAQELATPLDRRSVFDSLSARLAALSAPEDLEEARGLCDALERFCYEEPSSISALQAHLYRIHVHQRCFEPDLVAREMRALGQLASDWSLPDATWLHDRLALQERYYEGDVAALCDGLGELTQRAVRQRLRYGERYAHACLSHLRRELPPELVPKLKLGTDTATLERTILLWEARAIRSAIQAGRVSTGRSEFGRLSRAQFRDIPRDAMLLATLAELSQSAVMLEEREHAATLLELMLPFTRQNVTDEFFFSWGALGSFAGDLLVLIGEQRRALECYREALELNERLRHRPQVLRVRLAIGALAIAEPMTQQRKQAAEELREVVAEASELGLRNVQWEAERTLRKAGFADSGGS